MAAKLSSQRRVLVLSVLLVPALAADAAKREAAGPPAPAGQRVSFALAFKGETSSQPLLSAFVMPGEALELEALAAEEAARFEAQAEAGELTSVAARRWRWQAPQAPGLVRLGVTRAGTTETIAVHAFVLVPYDGRETLNGYRIGSYEPEPLRGNPAYTVPAGFVEVTRENEATLVSPHFRLKQFLCKQPGGYPKYVVLRERLLHKLEALLARANEQGYEANSFFVMSGYRTPWYNRSIGNKTTYSRHCYGDAADVYIDRDRDGLIDDLDRDGSIGHGDGQVLYDLVAAMLLEERFAPFRGGLHLYRANAAHGPMVHVDARGWDVRW